MAYLIIQIPCYNEAETLPETLGDLPLEIPGISKIETLIIDDGSTDDTVTVAERLGVNHIVRHNTNRGLATVFETGINTCLELGADIIVNTDGDNQYPGQDIDRLIEPILQGQADMVIGDRQTKTISHFSPLKRLLQRLGSNAVEMAAGIKIPDAASGFRAFSRDAALRINIFTKYTYTLETIIQAGKKGITITSIPITTNDPLRESRLKKSDWDYVKRSALTILRIYTFYEPLKTFLLLGITFLLPGLFLLLRFFYFYVTAQSGVARFVQSVVIGGTLTIVGVLIVILGILADLISANRLISEELIYRLKKNDVSASQK
ncbi:MAG: glycosyltransferase family 2 protein [Chloroflexota bacterium]